jgi:uncharacterized Fe-S cluster-containing radical SAM superfamily protein
MPKVVLNKWKNAEQGRYVTERTKLYNEEIKAMYGDKVTTKNVAEYLSCSMTSVYRYLGGVKRCGRTKLYNSIDVARRLAEREEGLV